MSQPKLARIINTVAARLADIDQASGYYTDIGTNVRRDRREPGSDELPACLVYLGERLVETTNGARARCEMTITVMAYDDCLGDAEARGIELLADIQRAVELPDVTLDGLIRDQHGLAFVSDEIFMPEIGTTAVGARVTYSAPHIRNLGDPEIS